MILKEGDILVCDLRENTNGLTYGKRYIVIGVSDDTAVSDQCLCVVSNSKGGQLKWWFGQIGSKYPWTEWFVTETVWNRSKKFEDLGI
jgi:hypothetical protein